MPAPAAERADPEMFAAAESESLLPRAPRRRDVNMASKRSDGDDEADPPSPGRHGRRVAAGATSSSSSAAMYAQKAVIVIFLCVSVYWLTASGVSDDMAQRVPPTIARYVPSEPHLVPAADLFALPQLPAGCGGVASRIECVIAPSAALARTLDSRPLALAMLLPCWSLFRRHPTARRVLVFKGGVRLGTDVFAPALVQAMRADVLLPADVQSGLPGARALPAEECALSADRRGPARTGWPTFAAPPAPSAQEIAAALAARVTRKGGGHGGTTAPSEIVIDQEDDDPSTHTAGNVSALLLAKLVKSLGPVQWATDATDVPALAQLLAPATPKPSTGDGSDATPPGGGGSPRAESAEWRREQADGFGGGNLSLAVGLIEPDGGLGMARPRMLRSIARRMAGFEKTSVRQVQLGQLSLHDQARFVRAHGLLVVSHGASGSEALLFIDKCTAVLELYPNFHYRPDFFLPLVLAAGGIPFLGRSASEPERHTWQRLVTVGAARAEKVLRPPPITPASIAEFLPTMVAAREACLRGSVAT